jgi:hypothetical protein
LAPATSKKTGVPAGTVRFWNRAVNGETLRSLPTSVAGYAVKTAKGAAKFHKRGQHVVSACSDATVSVTKPSTLLVPSLTSSQTPPTDNLVDHYLCYAAKAKGAIAKNAQADVVDARGTTTRWDLKKLSLVCNPVDKSGTPTLLAGPDKKQAFPITPASVRTPDVHLLCYEAKLAKKNIPQTGCGPTNPKDKGTKIKQGKPASQGGIATANQFGTRSLDTKKATLLCLPGATPAS